MRPRPFRPCTVAAFPAYLTAALLGVLLAAWCFPAAIVAGRGTWPWWRRTVSPGPRRFAGSPWCYVSIFGCCESEYMRQSFGTGFEFSVLPLKWVILDLDPAPLHGGSPGLAFRLPWVLPGFAGILAAWWIAARRPGRAGLRTHLLVGGAVVLHWAMYLCYRDLHPEGLWRYDNYHHFKWTAPSRSGAAGVRVGRFRPDVSRPASLIPAGSEGCRR